MKAVFLNNKGGYEDLVAGDLPKPEPGKDEVLIKVYATAVMPTEFQWFPTFNTADKKTRAFPIVPSHEFSGTVAALGAGVKGVKVGDAVYGLNDWFKNGALAEFCVAPISAIALKPIELDHLYSTVVPISALTAWQGLFDRGKLNDGQTVLIHGGAGAVGMFAVQLAHWHGAKVIATASTKNLEFVRGLGADQVIDYTTTRFEEVVRNVDVVFDTVGGDTLERSWKTLKPGGRGITIATQSEGTNARTKEAFFIVEPNRVQLTNIAGLLDAKTIRAFVEGVYPLADAKEAYARAARGGMRGKVVVQLVK